MADLEPIAHDIWRDARLLSCASACELAPFKDDLIEAREALNDAIDKAERVREVA